MVGIIGAMDVEVAGLSARMETERTEDISGVRYYTGTLNGAPCVLARCGPGKVNAAVCAQTLLLRWPITAIINIGVAGGMGQGVRIGHLVLADAVVQHDVDTSALGDPVGMVSGVNLTYFPASERLNTALAGAAQATGYGSVVHRGVIATGDQFIAGGDKLREISERFSALACEMEGGAIAQVCHMNGVEFAVARAISDNANDTAHVDFPAFVQGASSRMTALLYAALPNL